MAPSSAETENGCNLRRTALDIRYNGETIHRIEDLELVASRSPHFESLLNQSGHGVHDCSAHDIPVLEYESVGEEALKTVLDVLEEKPLTTKMLEGSEQAIDKEVLLASFYLGCDPYILPLYCRAANPKSKLVAARFLCRRGQDDELERLVKTPMFFDGFSKATIPLYENFSRSPQMVSLLLNAYEDAPESTFMERTKSFWGTVAGLLAGRTEEQVPNPLEIGCFGMTVLRKLAGAEWSPEELQSLFSALPATSDGYEKPAELEGMISEAIRYKLAIPDVLRNWKLDHALIAPALFDAGRLGEASDYPDPEGIIRAVSESWSPEDCVDALEENWGGIRQLLVALDLELDLSIGGWFAKIPVFPEACVLCEGETQRLLYQRLFLHREFDPLLPPALLATLPLNEEDVQQRVLNHAVQYLEDENWKVERECDLPWGELDRTLAERAAFALRYRSKSPLRKYLPADILKEVEDKLGEESGESAVDGGGAHSSTMPLSVPRGRLSWAPNDVLAKGGLGTTSLTRATTDPLPRPRMTPSKSILKLRPGNFSPQTQRKNLTRMSTVRFKTEAVILE